MIDATAPAAATAMMRMVLRLAADLLDRDQPALLEGALEVRVLSCVHM